MLKTALSIYFSVLYTGIHIDTKGNVIIKTEKANIY